MDIFDAVIKNDVKQVQCMLESGVDSNICEDAAEIRPLHFAAQNNSLEAAQLLIAAGADPKQQTEEGETP